MGEQIHRRADKLGLINQAIGCGTDLPLVNRVVPQ
jgi:hypothetical protein